MFMIPMPPTSSEMPRDAREHGCEHTEDGIHCFQHRALRLDGEILFMGMPFDQDVFDLGNGPVHIFGPRCRGDDLKKRICIKKLLPARNGDIDDIIDVHAQAGPLLLHHTDNTIARIGKRDQFAEGVIRAEQLFLYLCSRE